MVKVVGEVGQFHYSLPLWRLRCLQRHEDPFTRESKWRHKMGILKSIGTGVSKGVEDGRKPLALGRKAVSGVARPQGIKV
jgi:hypothetical protein